MNIILLYPEVAKESATRLAKALKIEAINPFLTDKRDFREYLGVINYGCNRNIKYQNIFNTPEAIAQCKDKVKTLTILELHGVKCIPFVTSAKNIPPHWNCITIREKLDGYQNEGLSYAYKGEAIPVAPLYTEYFPHDREYRVCVFNKQFAVAYEKQEEEGEWHLIKSNLKSLLPIKQECIKAAAALGIDFVGFDVLVNKQNDFSILEANSAPVLTDEMLSLFLKYFKG